MDQTSHLSSHEAPEEWWRQARARSLAVRTPYCIPILTSERDTKSPVTHYIQYAYSRLITVTICLRSSPSDILRAIATLEGNDVADYRWLRMSSSQGEPT